MCLIEQARCVQTEFNQHLKKVAVPEVPTGGASTKDKKTWPESFCFEICSEICGLW